jgi:hypothetical protein
VLSLSQISDSTRQAVRNSVSPFLWQSLPIPTKINDKPHLLFFYCRANVFAKQPNLIFSPHHLAFVDPNSGKIEEIREVMPADFGELETVGDLLGVISRPENYQDKLKRALALYDSLLPEFYGFKKSPFEELKGSASELLDLLKVIIEPELGNHYEYLGNDFFSWLNLVACHIPSDTVPSS